MADGNHGQVVYMLNLPVKFFSPSPDTVSKGFHQIYHWSLDQVEFATDLVFAKQSDLQAVYERPTRAAIHPVKPDNIAAFLGRKLLGSYTATTRIRWATGTIRASKGHASIRHTMGRVTIKMYDKFRLILRIETTVVDVSFLQALPTGRTQR